MCVYAIDKTKQRPLLLSTCQQRDRERERELTSNTENCLLKKQTLIKNIEKMGEGEERRERERGREEAFCIPCDESSKEEERKGETRGRQQGNFPPSYFTAYSSSSSSSSSLVFFLLFERRPYVRK